MQYFCNRFFTTPPSLFFLPALHPPPVFFLPSFLSSLHLLSLYAAHLLLFSFLALFFFWLNVFPPPLRSRGCFIHQSRYYSSSPRRHLSLLHPTSHPIASLLYFDTWYVPRGHYPPSYFPLLLPLDLSRSCLLLSYTLTLQDALKLRFWALSQQMFSHELILSNPMQDLTVCYSNYWCTGSDLCQHVCWRFFWITSSKKKWAHAVN